MGSSLPILVMAMLAVGMLLVMLLPSEFRRIFSQPANFGDRLLVRSLGLMAVVTRSGILSPGDAPKAVAPTVALPACSLGFT